jgi:hypothetical protein
MCWILTIIILIMVNGTIKTFNETIKNVEDKTQDMMITSLNVEIVELKTEMMDIGWKLDSMVLKYDFNYKMD